jgi:hypothetical protein
MTFGTKLTHTMPPQITQKVDAMSTIPHVNAITHGEPHSSNHFNGLDFVFAMNYIT